MNRYEINKVMECMNSSNKGCYYRIETQRFDLDFHHSDKYYAVVQGVTPYKLALLINKKYDNSKYHIRVCGGHESEKPTGNVYIYHIDTVEGLVAFVLETKDYYSKTHEYTDKMGQLLDRIYTKILEGVSPRKSVYDWMLEDEHRKDYFRTVLSTNTYLDYRIRKKIESFDKAVNPYCCNDIEINNFGLMISGVVSRCRYNGEKLAFHLKMRKVVL